MPTEGGFVAGTMVHTQEGLRPIEQIKVGDYVLSKPESGNGELSYKRVMQTFEHENSEVYLVNYVADTDEKKYRSEHVAATGNYPLWVERLGNYAETKVVSAWVSVDKFFDLAVTGSYPVFELYDGRLVKWDGSGPLVRTTTPEVGIVYMSESSLEFEEGWGVDFSKGFPERMLDEKGRWKSISLWNNELSAWEIEPDDYVKGENSILSRTGGHHPILRKVYNLEAEDTSTYFVGAAGVLVHSTSGNA